MVHFFGSQAKIIAVYIHNDLTNEDKDKLKWLFSGLEYNAQTAVSGIFAGPRKEMITPWSTNATEIASNMGINGVFRIEEFFRVEDEDAEIDPMLQQIYSSLDQDIFTIDKTPNPIIYIDDIESYNQREGLALNPEEIQYLENLSQRLNRKLTDSEVFGFSQVNSEHCRHKIFNGTFIIDGQEKPSSLFQLIKKTSNANPNYLVSAYKDNVAFIQGPYAVQFAPQSQDKPDFFTERSIETVISLKAETHNFPTTVEPFNGAATGTGGEIRDRLAGGRGSLPLAGTAVYMTAYPRTQPGRVHEKDLKPRSWLYQTPEQILIKASNGASDFGNKFGQPLICGSVLTFEYDDSNDFYAYDKVIMLAGGIGFGNANHSKKDSPGIGDKVIVMGGDNYRIGMGGGAVSSVATGEYTNAIELNAVQRSNPEMQKRVMNAIRAMSEDESNPVVSIHDHGAGGHLNCLSELVEESGGVIDMTKLPVGDPTLSDKEIAGNESQERMGLVIKELDLDKLDRVAKRERAPLYVAGETTGNQQFVFRNKQGQKPIDLQLADMFGNPPSTIMRDEIINRSFDIPLYHYEKIEEYIFNVLQMEAVACKDWLTNKVDRSVTGKVAKQQCCGSIQLPLNNLGVTALDYQGLKGVATSIGHAPQASMINAADGAVLSVAEALTNLVWAPLTYGLKGVSLSANWMWPCRNPGEDARLYEAVEGLSDFVMALGINVPTGKDSLSMTQKYPDGTKVISPGTVIISTVAETEDVKKVVEPAIRNRPGSVIYRVDFSDSSLEIGGSAFAQSLNKLGNAVPKIPDPVRFKNTFEAVQQLIKEDLVLAGHDVSAGGMITTLLEMLFPEDATGLEVNMDTIPESNVVKILFSENPCILIQVEDTEKVEVILQKENVIYQQIGKLSSDRKLRIHGKELSLEIDPDQYRDVWFQSSYLLDRKQSGESLAAKRYENYKKQPLYFRFPDHFNGKLSGYKTGYPGDEKTAVAAIIREKGVNGDREMAYSLFMSGFKVKDVHMTDLVSGNENLEDTDFIVFVGGFSNSDVLGSAKGWAGAFIYNEKAKDALEKFYLRPKTLSLGICNGCQLMVELNLIYPHQQEKPKMNHNDSHKFESSFLNMEIPENNSVMLKTLSGSRLGVWVAHGEGKFILGDNADSYNICGYYGYENYPANPNGSDFNTAAICSHDGRHLAMMPHLERAVMPWQWAKYPEERKYDEVTPWTEAFINAKNWILERK